MRRSHDALTGKTLSTDPTTGETHLRHHVTADGYYKGKLVIKPKEVEDLKSLVYSYLFLVE